MLKRTLTSPPSPARRDAPFTKLRSRIAHQRVFMDKIGTWLAIIGVVIGFAVLAWLLFAESPRDKRKK